jgi:hypothetical protein
MELIPTVWQYLNWKPGFNMIISQDVDTAICEANKATEHMQIFTDGSHREGKIGVAADLWIGNFRDVQA